MCVCVCAYVYVYVCVCVYVYVCVCVCVCKPRITSIPPNVAFFPNTASPHIMTEPPYLFQNIHVKVFMHGTITSKTILNTVDPQYNIGTGRQFQDPSYKLSALYVKLTLIQFWNPWYYVQLYSDWNTRNLRYISDFISPMLLALGGRGDIAPTHSRPQH
jgi:hypothetical protein